MTRILRPLNEIFFHDTNFVIFLRCVEPSVHPSVGPSVHWSHTSWISEKWAEFEQNSIRNKILCHLKDNLKTSTRGVLENASVVWTLFDLFFFFYQKISFIKKQVLCLNLQDKTENQPSWIIFHQYSKEEPFQEISYETTANIQIHCHIVRSEVLISNFHCNLHSGRSKSFTR